MVYTLCVAMMAHLYPQFAVRRAKGKAEFGNGNVPLLAQWQAGGRWVNVRHATLAVCVNAIKNSKDKREMAHASTITIRHRHIAINPPWSMSHSGRCHDGPSPPEPEPIG
jgi:hypothetical protein